MLGEFAAVLAVQEILADHDPLPDHRDHRRGAAGRRGDHRRLSAYGEAARTAKHEPEKFGKGAVEGLMAAECANNASTGGSMTILLSLGSPGSNTTAMMIAAFMIHGMQPGPLLLSTRPDIVYGIFVGHAA
ncbi:MAG: tripartite tricarboxylate transporter permease [Desulfobacterales bacterium]|nr:tripartite tricarboxylate transporter permease [Desulfobacterales bacterium]